MNSDGFYIVPIGRLLRERAMNFERGWKQTRRTIFVIYIIKIVQLIVNRQKSVLRDLHFFMLNLLY